MKAFNGVTKFAQDQAQWKEFHFDFGVLIGAEYPPLLETLKVVEQMTDETDTPMVRALDGAYVDLEKVSKELNEVLMRNSRSRMSSTMTGFWRITVSTGTTTGEPWREYFD